MSSIRDLDHPSGADIETFVNQQLAKLAQNLNYGAANSGGTTRFFKAEEYDFRCDMANSYPGNGWEYVEAMVIGVNVVIVWRMSRVKQAELGLESIMKLTAKKA